MNIGTTRPENNSYFVPPFYKIKQSKKITSKQKQPFKNGNHLLDKANLIR